MKYYDFKKAKEIIEKHKESIISAYIGMHEDWFWTAQALFEDESFQVDLDSVKKICGISGSPWATPVLEVELKDGTNKTIECFTGESSKEEHPSFVYSLGVLSAPIQKERMRKEVIIQQPRGGE